LVVNGTPSKLEINIDTVGDEQNIFCSWVGGFVSFRVRSLPRASEARGVDVFAELEGVDVSRQEHYKMRSG
jgi:hypothetical protein